LGFLELNCGLDHDIGHLAEIKTQTKRVAGLVEVENG
jgi:hypothetical protein